MSAIPLTSYISLQDASYRDNLLSHAIAEGAIDREPLIDSHRVSRRALKAVQIGISMCSNGSYFPIILRAGAVYAVGNGISFFALDYWAVNATLNDALGPRGAKEIELIDRNSIGTCYQGTLTASALGLSLLAVAPIALPTLDYDGRFGALGMIAVFLGGSILPLRSIQLSLNKSIQGMTCVLGEAGKKIEAVRSEMIALIDEYQDAFVQLGTNEKLRLISEHEQIREMSEAGKVGKYLSTVLVGTQNLNAGVAPTKNQRRISLAKNIGRILPGAFLAACLETALAMYTFSKAQEYITSSDIGAGAFTAVTIGSGIYLNGKSIVATTHRFTSAFFDGLRCRRKKGISEQLRPKLSACLKLIGLTLNLGTIGSTLVIFGDFFKNDESKKNFYEVTISAAYFLLTATATLDLVDETIKELILQKGNEDEKQIIHFCEGLAYFKCLLEKSSLLDFSIFVLQCPDEVKLSLLEKVNLSFALLKEHVDKHTLSASERIQLV